MGNAISKPGIGTRLLTWVIRVIPKVGPFAALTYRTPTPEVEKMFMASFNASVDNYRTLLASVGARGPQLVNENLDTGEPTRLGQYKGADEAYAKLLEKLTDHQFAGVKKDLRENILAFYTEIAAPAPSKSNKKEQANYAKLVDRLDQLRTIRVSAR